MARRAVASPLSSFIGRRAELAELERIARSERLLTLWGPGGIGKSRLAAELAARAARRGVTVGAAELAPIDDPSAIAPAVAAAFGVVGDERTLCSWLGRRPALLILDNCEHLVDAAAELATRLLASAPGLRIVATSREPLGLSSERVWPVPPLSLPNEDSAGWARSDAVHLFVERARAAVPGFAADAKAASRVVQVCRQLDGLPLAIELAAKTLASIPLDELVPRLDEPLELLGRGAAKRGRQDIIRRTIERSHAILDTRERQVLRRLSVFHAGFAVDAAEHVCADADVRPADVLPLVAELAHKSLVEVVQDGRGGRYRMLEVIRQFALERLREAGEVDLAERRRAEHVGRLFDQYDPASKPDPTEAMRRIFSEHANVRAAMSWALAHDSAIARKIAAKVWLAYVFPRPGIDPVEIEGWVRRTLEADCPHDGERARMLIALSQRRFAANDPVASRAHAEEALTLASAAGDHHARGGAHQRLAISAHAAGDLTGAVAQYSAALQDYGAMYIPPAQAWALGMRAAARSLAGDAAGARADFDQAVALSSAFPRAAAVVRTLEGEHHARQGDLDDARRCFEQALTIHQEIGSGVPLARALHGLADIAARGGRSEHAVRLAGAAAAIASWSGETSPAPTPMASLEQARRQLGSRAEAVREEGRRATVDQAIALALGGPRTRLTLSRREREIAVLVADGSTSREIADRLGISERTAENHVEHILVKLGVRSRVQIARWVAEQGAP